MDPAQQKPRGRARGRARGTPLPGAQEGDDPRRGSSSSEEMDVDEEARQREMFEGSGSPNGSGSNGSNGRGSPSERGLPRGAPGGNGNGNGNGGNGNGNGGNGNGGEASEEPRMALDYVVTRPTREFDKKGIYGPNDQRIAIISNYYAFRQKPDFEFRLYHVTVEPEIEQESKARRIVGRNRDEIGAYLLSGRQMFRTGPIKGEIEYHRRFTNVKISDDDVSGEVYTVSLQYVRSIDPSEPLVFQFFNVLARQMQSMLNLKMLGRHFFDPSHKRDFGSYRLELWPGFQNSIRHQEQKMLLNVECVWKVLQTENVFEKIKNIRRDNPQDWQRICNEEFAGKTVVTNYNKKAYRIEHIDFSKHASDTFQRMDKTTGQLVNVRYIDYYADRYNVIIRIESQPLIKTIPTRQDIRRGQLDGVYLVPELCWLSGLTEQMRGNFRLMKDLAVCLHMKPSERVTTMQNFVDKVLGSAQIKDEMKRWGCILNHEPVEFEARTYEPEQLVFAGNRRYRADDKADWTMAMRTEKMLTTVDLKKWVVIVGQRDQQSVGQLVSTMQKVATPLGYRIAPPLRTYPVMSPNAQQYTKAIEEAIKNARGDLDMIFIILANNNADNYAAVKKMCAIQYGIPSQCFLSKHFQNTRGLMSICTKLVIQMNAKQGGEPWGAVVPLKDMMVLGYDVHHAGPGGGGSYGAMTATMNASYGQYFSCVEKQLERSEIYTHVAQMFFKCLVAYKKKNGVLPKRILMYRDGVGEGQLNDAYTQELKGFEDKIEETYGDAEKPKLTYIVVNKRINTRFFVKLPRGNDYDNPKPGLVVDDVVTRPERYDFFLVSQIARQGCVSPTYYNVLKDGSGLAPDKIQRLTFKFCHLYFNWTGTVAVPAPCQNAHKLALLTGTALKGAANRNLDYLLHFL